MKINKLVKISKNIKDLAKTRLLIIEPHGSDNFGPFSKIKFSLPDDTQTLKDYLHLKKDTGAPELAQELLRLIPGTVVVSIITARGLVDMNRSFEFSLANFFDEDSKNFLLKEIYEPITNAIDKLILSIPKSARILCLHSMNTNVNKKILIDKSSESIKNYIECHQNNVGITPKTNIDIISGPEGHEDLADLRMRDTLKEILLKNGYEVNENFPYRTEFGKHKTTDYMQLRPGKVIAIDFAKDLICEGSSDEKTFSYTKSKADKGKTEKVAVLIAKAIEKELRTN